MQIKNICIIGAGASGLVSAKYLLNANFQISIFEKTDQVGGTWVYRDDPNDPYFSDTSMYKSLRTNLPKQIMKFSDFPFPENVPNFPGHHDVKEYLKDYSIKFGIYPKIKFEHEVIDVKKLNDSSIPKWKVQIRKSTNEIFEEEFDAVVVCNGHFTIPFIPEIKGLFSFNGKYFHSHIYRTPEKLFSKNDVVLVVGAGPSGQEIALELSLFGCTVYHSSRSIDQSNIKSKYGTILMPPIKCIENNIIEFLDGTKMDSIQKIIFCTGYKYTYPFLEEEIKVTNNKVSPLYEHLFHCDYENLVFIGLNFRVIPFPLFEIQAKWVTKVFAGQIKLPNKEERWKEYNRIEALNIPNELYHCLPGQQQFDYYNRIASILNEPKRDELEIEIYKETSKIRNEDISNFRDREIKSILEYERRLKKLKE